MYYTAEDIYNRLVDVDRILTITGQIRFTLGDVSIIVRQKDVVGNIPFRKKSSKSPTCYIHSI